MGSRIPLACLCGSTRFKDEWIYTQRALERAGIATLSVSHFTHHDNLSLSDEEKACLDELHLRKIEIADLVVVINVGGYVGESTGNEIAHARRMGKPLLFIRGVEEGRIYPPSRPGSTM